MINIREYIKNPANALEFMCLGIERQSKRDGFIINMRSFGECRAKEDVQVCSGCAATCAVQEIAGKNLTIDNIQNSRRAEALEFDYDQLIDFEGAINEARMGELECLFEFFDLYRELNDRSAVNDIIFCRFNFANTYDHYQIFELNSKNILEISKVRTHIKMLRAAYPTWSPMPVIN